MSIHSLILTLLLLSFSAIAEEAPLKEYTLTEVATHNTEDSCWLIMDKKVYDVTKYIPKHDAPKKVMLNVCGKEATEDFNKKGKLDEKHSKKAIKLREDFLIGTLKES